MLAERYSVPSSIPATGDPMPPFMHGLLLSLFLLPSAALAADAAPPKPMWDYMGGGNADEDWGSISQVCTTGKEQSPVGINYTTISTMPALEPHYRKSKMRMQRMDHTLVIDVSGNNTITDQNRTYKLTQIRMHSPSEHTIKSRMYALEFQLIHKDEQGHTMITGIFFQEEGATPNPALQQVIDLAPQKRGDVAELSFDPSVLLPQEHNGYYAYTGSLSWPPCTEGVEWRVYKQAVPMTKTQLRQIAAILRRNARTLQPVYLRTIKETMF